LSDNNHFSIKAIVNKPATMRQTANGIPYAGVSVGIPRYNKETRQTEYTNVYIKVWRELAQLLSAHDAKGYYRFIGEIRSYQDTSGQGQSKLVTEFSANTVEKLVYIPKQQNQNGNGGQPQQQNFNNSMSPGQPARSPNQFQNNGGPVAQNFNNTRQPPNQPQQQQQQFNNNAGQPGNNDPYADGLPF